MPFPIGIMEELRNGKTSSADQNESRGLNSPSLTRQSSTLSLQLYEDTIVQGADKQEKPSRQDYSKGLGVVYGGFLVILGIIFPMAEALNDEWLRTEYHLVFQMYITVVAIAFLLYLQFYILKHHESDHHEPQHPFNLVATLHRSEDGLVTMESRPASDPLKRKYKVPSRTSFYLGDPGTPKALTRKADSPGQLPSRPSFHLGDPPSALRPGLKDDLKRVSSFSAFKECDDGMAWIDLSTIGSIFDHEGSSLFLRFGTLIFAVGNLIYVSLELEYALSDPPEGCKKQTYGWVYVFRFIFVLVQTFLLLKNSSAHVHKHHSLVRMGYYHLIATNLCIWIRTLTSEILEEYLHNLYDHKDDYYTTTTTPPLNLSAGINEVPQLLAEGCLVYSGVLVIITPFLFPFVLEYSLIAMGTIAIFLVELDDIVEYGHNQLAKGINNLIKVPKFVSSNVNSPEYDEHQGGMTSKSNSGIFAGGLILAGVIVSCITFFYALDTEEDKEKAQLIYLSSDIALHVAMLLATFGVLYKMNSMAFVAKPTSVDDLLVLVAMLGAVMFELSILTSTCTYLVEIDQDYLHILTLVSATVSCIQTIVQVLAVMVSLRRYPANEEQAKTMPGRGLLSFLIIANVSTWIFRTMETKKSDVYVADDFYGISAWLIISNISLPLLLFYRFHSAVCLADVWHQGYVPLSAKFQSHAKNALSRASSSRSNSAANSLRYVAYNNNFEAELDRNSAETTVHL